MKKIIVGSMVLISALALSACSIGSGKSAEITTDEYDFDENIENIQLDISVEDVHIMVSEDDECHIVFSHLDSIKTTVEVKNDTLVISEKTPSFNFDLLGADLEETKLDIYIPEGELSDIDIDIASGDILLTNIVADTIDIDTASGDVIFDASDAQTIEVNTASGDISGTLLSGKDFDVNTAAGDINVPRNSEGGSCNINTASGDVDLEVA